MRFPVASEAPGHRTILLAAFLVATGLVLGACAPTGVSTRYYDISGNSAADLDRELKLKGPKTERGKAVATAAIQLKPLTMEPDRSGGQCRFRTVKFGVKAQITLPRWREEAFNQDKTLSRSWANFAAYAKAHEEEHVRIAEIHARRMEKALLAIPPQRTCQALVFRAKNVIRRFVEIHEKAQLAFDERERKRFVRARKS